MSSRTPGDIRDTPGALLHYGQSGWQVPCHVQWHFGRHEGQQSGAGHPVPAAEPGVAQGRMQDRCQPLAARVKRNADTAFVAASFDHRANASGAATCVNRAVAAQVGKESKV